MLGLDRSGSLANPLYSWLFSKLNLYETSWGSKKSQENKSHKFSIGIFSVARFISCNCLNNSVISSGNQVVCALFFLALAVYQYADSQHTHMNTYSHTHTHTHPSGQMVRNFRMNFVPFFFWHCNGIDVIITMELAFVRMKCRQCTIRISTLEIKSFAEPKKLLFKYVDFHMNFH